MNLGGLAVDGLGDFSSAVNGVVNDSTMPCIAAAVPASISAATVDSHGTFNGRTRIPGMPLLEAAECASLTKPGFASNTTGVPKSSIAIPL